MGIVTGRNEVVAKVMFSLVSVILFTGGGMRGKGGGMCGKGGCAWQRGVCVAKGLCMAKAKGGMCGEGGCAW